MHIFIQNIYVYIVYIYIYIDLLFNLFISFISYIISSYIIIYCLPLGKKHFGPWDHHPRNNTASGTQVRAW